MVTEIKKVREIWFDEEDINFYDKEDRRIRSYPRGYFSIFWLGDIIDMRIEKIDDIEQPVKIKFKKDVVCTFDELFRLKELYCSPED